MDKNWLRKKEELNCLLKSENIDPYEDDGLNNNKKKNARVLVKILPTIM